ncbi:MAG: zinc ribbon domain-containing protein [bacterium]|nr:zinc ribbon domain-containing protein [bacterium]
MKYCSNCKNKIEEGDGFCESCGYKIDTSSVVSSASVISKKEKVGQLVGVPFYKKEWFSPAVAAFFVIGLVGIGIAVYKSSGTPIQTPTPSISNLDTLSVLPPQIPTPTPSPASPPSPSISNPDYLKDPSAYLVDYDNKISLQIQTGKALWVEKIKNSVTLKVSYSIVRAGQNIIVFHDLQIPGLSTLIYWGAVDKDEPNQCQEKAAIDFLTKNLLHTEVYLAYEGIQNDTTTWRLLMPASNGKDTADVAAFIVWNGYGKHPFNEPFYMFSKTGEGSFLKYPTPYTLRPESTPASELTDAQVVASLAKRGFWGTCK